MLDCLGVERPDLLGYSRGGRIVLEFALMYPDRIGRIVVGGAHPFAQDMTLFRNAVRDGMDDWIALIEQLGGPLPKPLRNRIERNDVQALQAAVADDRRDISGPLENLSSPSLFFTGAEDPLREQIQHAAAMLASARLIEIAGCNHVTALQRSDLVLPHLLRFLHEV